MRPEMRFLASAVMTGPISDSGSVAGPTFSAWILGAREATSRSAVFSPTGTATEIAIQRSTAHVFLAAPGPRTALPGSRAAPVAVPGDRGRADEAHRLDIGMVEDGIDR